MLIFSFAHHKYLKTVGINLLLEHAGGYFGSVWQIQADLAWHPTWLGLPAHNALEPCQLCPAARENLFSITKRRKPVLHNAAEWRLRFDGPKLMKLFTVPGVSGLTVSPDIMHTKWLGVDTYLLGSAMAVMLKFKFNSDVDALHLELSRYFGYIYMRILNGNK